MAKLGPGSDADTRDILHRLPIDRFDVIVDAGCGTGRQTIVLARELRTPVHAIDTYEPFLEELRRRAVEAGVSHLVQAHCMDMKDIPDEFPGIDLLWSEGAAYNIGFADALAAWSRAIRPAGFAVVSELAWLTDRAPKMAREFFSAAYPDMRHTSDNVAIAARAGYRVLGTRTLPEEAWTEGYYDVLEERVKSLADHPDAAVRALARETAKEIDVFKSSEGSFGYVFYVLQRRTAALEPASRA